ncbi:MAG: hypothetical protein KDE50_15145 [Caldilineaceae bacterium]|nr:hypothetical protein [Caldilineaceae bacterium]
MEILRAKLDPYEGSGSDASTLLFKAMAEATRLVSAEVIRSNIQPLIAPQIHTPQESIPLAQSGFHATPPFALPEQTNDPLSTPLIDVPGMDVLSEPASQQQEIGDNVISISSSEAIQTLTQDATRGLFGRKSNQWRKEGNYESAVQDFMSLGLSDVSDRPGE